MYRVDLTTFEKMRKCIGYDVSLIRSGSFFLKRNRYVTPEYGDGSWESLVDAGYATRHKSDNAIIYMLNADGIKFMANMLDLDIEDNFKVYISGGER